MGLPGGRYGDRGTLGQGIKGRSLPEKVADKIAIEIAIKIADPQDKQGKPANIMYIQWLGGEEQ